MPAGVYDRPSRTFTCEECGISVVTKSTNQTKCDSCARLGRRERRAERRLDRQRHYWTEQEISVLEARYKTSSWSEIAAQLGLSVAQVSTKARQLGLAKKEFGAVYVGDGKTNIRLINIILKERNLKGCQICGEHRWLDIHHIDGNHHNNQMDNLMAVCPNHHADLERPPWVWRTCEVCGHEFLVSQSYLDRGVYTHYCSQECRETKIEKTCRHCGAVFKVGARDQAGKTQIYCSRRCQALSRRKENLCQVS